MSIFISIFGFIFLFFALCIFVMLAILLYNIFSKSYKPRNAITFVVVLLLLFLANTLLAFNSLSQFTSALNSQINTINPGSSSNNF